MPSSPDSPVVIAYDGSDEARGALAEAAGLFPSRPAVVVSVWRSAADIAAGGTVALPSEVIATGTERLDESAREQAAALAGEGMELLRERGIEAEAVELGARGAIWPAIADFAEEREAATVVVGARGRSGVLKVLLGSVSSGLVNHCRRPVLVVRQAGD